MRKQQRKEKREERKYINKVESEKKWGLVREKRNVVNTKKRNKYIVFKC